MSINQSGVAPGAKSEPERKKVAIACRVEGCGSKEAYLLPVGNNSPDGVAPSQRMYQCCNCKNTWGLQVGGYFPY